MKKTREFYMVLDPVRRRNELIGERSTALDSATAALEENKQADYTSAMEKVSNLDTEIESLDTLIKAKQKEFGGAPKLTQGEAAELAESRAADLMAGKSVTFDAGEVRAAIKGEAYNSTTLATGSLLEPTRVSTAIHDRLTPVSSVIDQVSVIDLTGTNGIIEPYLKSELTAYGGKVTSKAGQLRQDSDPSFGSVQIKPYELTVTSYVDRNLSKLTPVLYMEKIQSLAMRSMRRSAASIVIKGDGQTTPDMHGFYTAVDTDGAAMYKTMDAAAKGINVNILSSLYFAYGGDTELAGGARLYLTKTDLAEIGAIRGTNEKAKLFDIIPDAGNPNTGIIKDGGFIVPYTLTPDVNSLSSAAAGTSAVQTLIYGNPLAYELALFGGYSIRLDESYKAAERMITILGDVMLGGNIVEQNSFVIATVPAKAAGTP